MTLSVFKVVIYLVVFHPQIWGQINRPICSCYVHLMSRHASRDIIRRNAGAYIKVQGLNVWMSQEEFSLNDWVAGLLSQYPPFFSLMLVKVSCYWMKDIPWMVKPDITTVPNTNQSQIRTRRDQLEKAFYLYGGSNSASSSMVVLLTHLLEI